MKMVRCENGHLFDSDLAAACPYCAGEKRVCRNCGATLPLDARFCDRCGKPVSEDPYPEEDEQGRKGFWTRDLEHCANCGAAFRSVNDRFCRSCGTYRSGEPGKFFVPAPQYMETAAQDITVRQLLYRCAACGYQWEGPETERDDYCPKCGAGVTGSEPGFVLRTQDGREIEIPERGCVIGRQAVGKDILTDPSISRTHARFEPQGTSVVLVTDLSRNGTFVNDQRLTREEPVAVEAGSIIRLGDAVLTLGKLEAR